MRMDYSGHLLWLVGLGLMSFPIGVASKEQEAYYSEENIAATKKYKSRSVILELCEVHHDRWHFKAEHKSEYAIADDFTNFHPFAFPDLLAGRFKDSKLFLPL